MSERGVTDLKTIASVEAHKRALLVQRNSVPEDVVVNGMHDRARKITAGSVSPTFDEDAYVVLFYHYNLRRKKAFDLMILGMGIIVFGIALMFIEGDLHIGFKIAIVGFGGWFFFDGLDKRKANGEVFWETVNMLNEPLPAQVGHRAEDYLTIGNDSDPDHPLEVDPASVFDRPRRD